MNGFPAISVVTATCNGQRFVAEQIDSVVDQTLSPVELLVADDASDDGTIEIAMHRGEAAAFEVHAWRNPQRLGFAENFMAAARRARGELVAFCDQDDVWDPTKLATCAAAFQDGDVTLVVHDSELVDEHLCPRGARFPGILKDHRTSPATSPLWPVVPGSTMVVRRSVLDVLPWHQRPGSPRHNGPMVHDQWVYFVAAALGTVAWLSEPLAQHREHSDNATGQPSRSRGWRRGMSLARLAGAPHYRALGEHAQRCAGVLREHAPVEQTERFAARARLYETAAQRNAWRAQIHDPDSPTRDRTSAWLKMLRHRGYVATPGDLGWRAAAKDLLGVTGLSS